MPIVHRVYTKVNNMDAFEALKTLKTDKSKATWWHDSGCSYSVVTDLAKFVEDVFLDIPVMQRIKWPALVMGEVAY